MKKLFLIFILGIMGVFISSCDSTDDPITPAETGSVFITSTPPGAQIWIQGENKGTTPDTVSGIAIGSREIRLVLDEYRDTTFTVDIMENQTTSRNIILTTDLTLTQYVSVRLWETTGTTASQPSGLDLSLGMAYGISSVNNGLVDVYYSSNGFLIQSANLGSGMTRVTKFRVGTSNNLGDGENSPLQSSGTWVDNVTDTQANYFFLYDNDGHYSKAIISARGGGTPGNPAWVELTWWYNSIVDDARF